MLFISADPSNSNTIISNFQESIVTDTESKSIGIEVFTLVETENKELPITGMNINESLLATGV